MNRTIRETSSSIQLNVLLINNGRTLLPDLNSNARFRDIFDSIAQSCGGQFRCQLGECEVRIDYDNGSAIFGLKRRGIAVALCIFIWERYAQDALWESLVVQHWAMHEALGLPLDVSKLQPPKSVPWLGVSLAPSFFAKAQPETVRVTLTMVAALAESILHQQRGIAAAN